MTTEEKLHHFNSIILESTEAECNEAFEEYKKSMDKYFEEHKAESIEKQGTSIHLEFSSTAVLTH